MVAKRQAIGFGGWTQALPGVLFGLWLSAAAGLTAAENFPIRVYTQVQPVAGVEHARAARVSRDGKTVYILVAHSQLLGGFVEIAPDCIGANKLSYAEIQRRVAKVEEKQLAAQPRGERPGRAAYQAALNEARKQAVTQMAQSARKNAANCVGST